MPEQRSVREVSYKTCDIILLMLMANAAREQTQSAIRPTMSLSSC